MAWWKKKKKKKILLVFALNSLGTFHILLLNNSDQNNLQQLCWPQISLDWGPFWSSVKLNSSHTFVIAGLKTCWVSSDPLLRLRLPPPPPPPPHRHLPPKPNSSQSDERGGELQEKRGGHSNVLPALLGWGSGQLWDGDTRTGSRGLCGSLGVSKWFHTPWWLFMGAGFHIQLLVLVHNLD